MKKKSVDGMISIILSDRSVDLDVRMVCQHILGLMAN